jgi:hypothetical protein
MKSLLESLRELALPGESQLAGQADGSHKADEIALDFDDALKYWAPRIWNSLPPAQQKAVSDVEAHLSKMSGRKNARLWTESAMLEDEAWKELRRLADRAADSLEGAA